MSFIAWLIAAAIVGAAVVLILTRLGVLKDADGDSIPDVVEDAVEDAKELKKKVTRKKPGRKPKSSTGTKSNTSGGGYYGTTRKAKSRAKK